MKYLLLLPFLVACTASQPATSTNEVAAVATNPSAMDLGRFSVSLAVEDIRASYDFYSKMGFTAAPNTGPIENNWIVMSNGTTNIGLFQGMFEANIMTFNPTDARSLHSKLVADGMTILTSAGLDKEEGPCHFVFMDPDGNQILVDQHE